MTSRTKSNEPDPIYDFYFILAATTAFLLALTNSYLKCVT